MDIKTCCKIVRNLHALSGRINAVFSERHAPAELGEDYSRYDVAVFFGDVGSSCAATISVFGDALDAVMEALGPGAMLVESDSTRNRHKIIVEA